MRWPQFTLRDIFFATAIFGVVCALFASSLWVDHDLHTCALCRIKRIKYASLGHTWKTAYVETPCTPWYDDNVEPEHDHVWVHSPSTVSRDLSGKGVAAASRDPPGRTIWRLTPEEQIAIYQNLPDTSDGKVLFLRLADRASMADNQDWEILHRLQLWQAGDYKGDWQDAGN